MKLPRSPSEMKRLRHAAVLAAKPDARFLVQLIAGPTELASANKNKTAPQEGAAAYSSVMDADLAVRPDAPYHAA